MTVREKVIERLERVSYYFKSLLAVGWQGDSDIYREHMESVKMALTMLKMQEPRVLTWEEVKKAEVCWLEYRGYEPFATLEADTWNSEKYGKSYRCWNCMPTDEQRKAVKWKND